MAHIIVYDAKVINTINRGEKYWNSLEIGVFQSHLDEETKEELAYYMIGTYKRNYSAFYNTFFPFERDGVWYALYSRDYTCTRVMKLPECIDIGGEDPESCGFCPVDYFVPKVKDVYMPFGFVAGCVWGDDSCQPSGTLVMIPTSGYKPQKEEACGYMYVPIESLKKGDKVVSYRKKSRGLRAQGSVINEISSLRYRGLLITVTTENGKISKYTPDHICIAKINSSLKDKYCVYLMRKKNSFRIGQCVGIYGKKHSAGVKNRMVGETADAVWILSIHDTVSEALYQEAFLSWKFNIPDMRFVAGGNVRERNQDVMDQFWYSVGDLTDNAIECLNYFGRDIQYPFCYAPGRGHASTVHSRITEIRACNLLNDMEVLDGDIINSYEKRRRPTGSMEEFQKISVNREKYDGLVWSMDIDEDQTYVADGIVTHNCWKIEFIDLRRVSEGIIKRDSRMGYISIPRNFSRLSECISDVCMYGYDFSFDITSQNVYEFNWNEDPSPTQ